MHAADRLLRIQERVRRRRVLAPEDGAMLVAAIEADITTGVSIYVGMGLAGGWRTAIRRKRLIELVTAIGGDRTAQPPKPDSAMRMLNQRC